MREMLLPLLALIALSTRAACTDPIGKDGFNFYKDYLRGRSDDVLPVSMGSDRMLYFYRTPLQHYPGLLPTALNQEYIKRTGNAFKNHMLSKDIDDSRNKRSSKTALSLMMGSKHEALPVFHEVPADLALTLPDEILELPVESDIN